MKKITLVLTALALIGTSCTKELNNGGPAQEQHTLAAKLVGGSPQEAVPGTILVRLNAEAAAEIAPVASEPPAWICIAPEFCATQLR